MINTEGLSTYDYCHKRLFMYCRLNGQKDQKDKYLFDGQEKGKPYTQTSIRAFLKMNCTIANVPYKGVHAIRRFTGTWWIENKVPIAVAADMMGHSSSRTLEKHYRIHSPTYLKSIDSPLNRA